MTDYAGELLRVTVTADDFADAALTPDLVTGVYVTVYSPLGDIVVDETAMTYSEGEGLWYYLWDTRTGATPVPLPAGRYRLRCRVVDLDGLSSWEYKRVRLQRNPVIAGGEATTGGTDGMITERWLADDAVSTRTIQDGAVTPAKLAIGVPTSAELDAETSARQAADALLQGSVDDEATARAAGDDTLQAAVDALGAGGIVRSVTGAAPVTSTGGSAPVIGLTPASATAAGSMSAADKAKLDAVEAGATADMTASEILTAVKTVDGAGSGLDADLLDGQSSAAFEAAGTAASVVAAHEADTTNVHGIADTAALATQADVAAEASARSTDIAAEASARSAADTALVPLAQKGAADGVATLGSDQKLSASQVPAIAISDAFAVASQAAMLALNAQRGDVAIRTDLSRSFVLSTDSPSTLADWLELQTPADTVSSVNTRTGAVTGLAEQTDLDAHTSLTTSAHGGVVASTDARLTDARTPTAHAATHKGGGSDAIATAVASGAAGLLSGSDKAKLDGVEAGATADQSASEILAALVTVDGSGSGLDADTVDGNDTAYFLARANHTGTQTSSTVSDLTEAVQDVVGAMAVAGSHVSVSYDDTAGTLTVAVIGLASTDLSDFTEAVQDVIGALTLGGSGLTATYNDVSNTLTVDVNVDNSSIEVNADSLRVKAAGVTNAMLAGSIDNTKLATNPLARANHTGTQLMATISDAGTLATRSSLVAGDIPDLSATYLPLTGGAVTGTLSVGTTPATAGTVRLPNTGTVQARNAANSADIALLQLTSGNIVQVGASTATGVTVPAPYLALGATPATTNGALRMTNNTAIYWRDAANALDRASIQVDSSNVMTMSAGGGTGAQLDFRVGGSQYIIMNNTAGTVKFNTTVDVTATNILTGTTNGTQIGTGTTQKLGFWNATPVVQYSTTATTTGFTAGAGSAVDSSATFTGNTGTKAYTIGDVVRALKLCGLMAAS